MKEFDSPRGLKTFPLIINIFLSKSIMFDFLHQPNHKVSSLVFVTLNVCAIITVILSLVVTTMWFTSTDPMPNMEFSRNIIGMGIFLGYFISAMFCAAVAQGLRYLSSIAETQWRSQVTTT